MPAPCATCGFAPVDFMEVFPNDLRISDHKVRAVFNGTIIQGLEHIQTGPVVAIKEADVFPGGVLHARIAGGRQSLILLTDYVDIRIPLLVFLGYG